jgi:hypothetical protein
VSAVAAGAALLALAVSPLRVVAAPGESVTLTLRNTGAATIAVRAAPAAYRLTALLAVRTARIGGATLRDHAQVLLLTATVRGGALRVAARVGVVVVIRKATRLVHRLQPGRLRLAGGMLGLLVANRGNVDEWVGASRLRLSLSGRGALLVLRARPHRILAGASGLFEWRLPARIAGPVSVRAAVDGRVARRYRLRL